ncbi:response regulator [Bdellovibrionota bacterium FG-1]
MSLAILIVEDVDTMRSLLEQVVGGLEGVRVSGTARNGWEARRELTRRRPDWVLLDEVLPGESSLDLLKELEAQQIPVLLLTGIEKPDHSIPSGAIGRLVKPTWDDLKIQGGVFGTALRHYWKKDSPCC